MGKHICPAGWDNWRNAENEKTVRYAEYGNKGEGAELTGRVKWVRALTSEEAARYADWAYVFGLCSDWQPADAPVKP